MPEFRYTARDAGGNLVNGTVTGNDRAAAIRQVEQKRCVPIRIEVAVAGARASSASTASPSPKSGNDARRSSTTGSATEKKVVSTGPVQTLSHTHQYLFTEQLSHLLGAGMTLDEALGILTKRMKQPGLHGLSKGLHQALVDGRSLSQALRDYPKIFSPLYVNMVAAGEVSGALSEILKRLVAHLADVKALRDRVQQALVYPMLLVVAGIGMIIIFMTVVVPQLTGFFSETGGALPPATRLLLDVNWLFTRYWWAGLLAAGGGFMLWKAWVATGPGRLIWDTFLWKVPVYSGIMRYRFYAQFARTLGTLTMNGVTLLRALELLEEISGNEWVRLRLLQVNRAVVDGATLSTALGEQDIFPELYMDMMAVGEQTGRFGDAMQNIADVYERELDRQVQIISALVPPLVMLGIALVVGFVVFGILSAVFAMTSGLKGGIR